MNNFTFKTFVLTAGLALSATALNAQQIREGYVDYGTNTGSERFHLLMLNWQPGQKVSADDNFFYLARKATRTVPQQGNTSAHGSYDGQRQETSCLDTCQ